MKSMNQLKQRIKQGLNTLIKPSTNANNQAKREQLKTLAVIVGMALFGFGFYYFSSKQAVKPVKTPSHFAGAFGDSVGLEYDHARIETLLDQIAQTDHKVAALAQQQAHPATQSDDEAIRTQHQIAQLQQALKQVKQQLAQSPKPLDKPLTQANTTHQAPAFTQAGSLAKQRATHKPTPPVMNTLGIEDQMIAYPALAKTTERNAANYVWAGSFANGYLLTGIIGDAGTNSTKNKGTVAIRLTTDGTMPNGQSSHLKGCIVLGSTYGDLSSDSDVIHLETLSCASKRYSFEKKVYGSVFDLDAMQDLRGIPVLKAKPILSYAALAGLIAGVGDGLSAYGTHTSVTGAGVVQTPTSVLKSGLGEGLSKPADKITDYLMSIANMYHPIVVSHAGRKVTVLFQAGFWIDQKHQAYQSMQSIGSGKTISSVVTPPNVPQPATHLAQQIALASGSVKSIAEDKAEGDFNDHKLQLGQALFSPVKPKEV